MKEWKDFAEVKVARRSALASHSPASARSLRLCLVINISPSVLINDPLRYARAATLMTQGCTFKNRAAVWGRLTAGLATNRTSTRIEVTLLANRDST